MSTTKTRQLKECQSEIERASEAIDHPAATEEDRIHWWKVLNTFTEAYNQLYES